MTFDLGFINGRSSWPKRLELKLALDYRDCDDKLEGKHASARVPERSSVFSIMRLRAGFDAWVSAYGLGIDTPRASLRCGRILR